MATIERLERNIRALLSATKGASEEAESADDRGQVELNPQQHLSLYISFIKPKTPISRCDFTQ